MGIEMDFISSSSLLIVFKYKTESIYNRYFSAFLFLHKPFMLREALFPH